MPRKLTLLNGRSSDGSIFTRGMHAKGAADQMTSHPFAGSTAGV